MPRGYCESKDTHDDLDTEIRKKRDKGYPLSNIIFEDSRVGVLYQNRQEAFRADLGNDQQIAQLLNQFFMYSAPALDRYDLALDHFKEQVPELAKGLVEIISKAHTGNRKFMAAFRAFHELCKNSINPNLSEAAVDEMLVQHLLTERLIRKIFDNPDFARKNAIAHDIEGVIDALTSRSFSRDEYLRGLDTYYAAIESAAQGLAFTEKQTLLNDVYERFFQGYSVKIADTHGIVYTPQPIVDFMCASVIEVLQTEFGKTLADPDVVLIDPAVGTGNFIVNLLRRAAEGGETRAALPDLYKNRLFANEVMLLPYYIAALNIEHAYYELAGDYEAFEGLCFVDTLDIAEREQTAFQFMTEKNTERVERQRAAPITVIIGNPPYNVGQVNENDNNKNRKYKVIDERVRETYAKDSKATLKTQLYDPYVKFFRWASDRLQGRDGIVCYVSNNSFVDQYTFDGMRKHLLQDFTQVYHIDLHGNVRKNPNLSGTTHNVFGIQVGVGITVAIRRAAHDTRGVFYHRAPENWRKEEKYAWLNQQQTASQVTWEAITPDKRHTWRVPEHADEFEAFMPMGTKEGKRAKTQSTESVFKSYSSGVLSGRDDAVYSFDPTLLSQQINQFCDAYNSEVDRFKRKVKGASIDDFVDYIRLKWSRNLKRALHSLKYADFDTSNIRQALYRPFTRRYLYFADILNDELSQLPRFLPTPATEQENRVIGLTAPGSEKPFMCLISDQIVDLHLVGAGASTQCFPFYVYDEGGGNRRENITDWALASFRAHYADQSISKWDVFYYVYGALHSPTYREKFAANLKRDLPRIPYMADFWHVSRAGRELARLHLEYETAAPYPLERAIASGAPVQPEALYRAEKMRLSKDKTAIRVNEWLTLRGLPPAAFDYRLGNRSGVEWVIDQYEVSGDKGTGITSDPNREDDPEYIVRLVGQVVAVSVETARIVEGLG
jgi:predicted helicase